MNPNMNPRQLATMLIAKWRDDPVAFALQALGVKLIWSRQEEMLLAVAEHDRVSVRSGHKVGKSTSAAILTCWWLATRRSGRVVMTSSGFRQVKDILWRELRRVVRESPSPLGGKVSLDPSTGWKFADGREAVGLSAAEPEKIAGYSGAEMLFIIDEASGVPEEIFEALEGNRASDGTKIVLFSNPTRTSGTFYETHHTKKRFWHAIHISSTESPNVTGECEIPGLAGPGWVREKQEEWGTQSSIYQVRVEGNFPTQGSNAVIGQHLVEMASRNYADTKAGDTLSIGVDVARFGDDETVIQGRRGLKALPAEVLNHSRTDEVAEAVVQYARRHHPDHGVPPSMRARVRAKVDVIGVGAGVADYLLKHYRMEIETVEVNVSEAATADGYSKLRDQIWFGIAAWLKDGGVYPTDDKLDQELVAPVYTFDPRGQRKVSGKDEIKQIIKRSPDRADALGLAVYEPPPEREGAIVFS